jgi:hypothetical protein
LVTPVTSQLRIALPLPGVAVAVTSPCGSTARGGKNSWPSSMGRCR